MRVVRTQGYRRCLITNLEQISLSLRTNINQQHNNMIGELTGFVNAHCSAVI